MDRKKSQSKDNKQKPVHAFMKPTLSYLNKKQSSPGISSAMTPEYTLRNFKKYLTKYEQKEILDYQQVWYFGKLACKIDAGTLSTSGYDTKRGTYRVIINDHLAYRFQILEKLGQCFSGQILKCMDHKPKQLVAIKVVRNKDGLQEVEMSETDIVKALKKFDEDNSTNLIHMSEKFYFRSHLCVTFDLSLDNQHELHHTNKIKVIEDLLKKHALDMLKCLELHKEEMGDHGLKITSKKVNGTVDTLNNIESSVLLTNAQKTPKNVKQTKPSAPCRPQRKSTQKSSVKTLFMSPEYVLEHFKQKLTKYEQKEIRDYKQVWYIGKKVKKIDNAHQAQHANSGYDTEEGLYIAMVSDHIAYRYEILEVLGQGFSGQVLKCMDHKTDQLVAIKVIRNQQSTYNSMLSEVRMLEKLRMYDINNTANIAHMREKFIFRNHLSITFDYFLMDLYSFHQSKNGKLPRKELKKYTVEILKCLQLLKKHNIVHGDLKPENVLIYKKEDEMHVAVTDFGGSYFTLDEESPRVFTKAFMSPELLLGKKCEPPMDMWSLGCTVAELYSGFRLFSGCDHPYVFNKIMEVLSLPPMGLVVGAPKRRKFFGSNGISYMKKCRITLAAKLNSSNEHFLSFIRGCLEYDPQWRMTPTQALKHPWIHDHFDHEPFVFIPTAPDCS